MEPLQLNDPQVSYGAIDDYGVFSFIEMVRKGIKFSLFSKFAIGIPFSQSDWSNFLHISERTLQRYQKEQGTFDSPQSERILEIALLYNKGKEVFGDSEKFNLWLDSKNLALGGIKPKSLFDSTFGINLLKDELTKIEYGVLA
jgi:putative toxin-antitoxin system antitoxin component (TIGR02293 family)